MTDNQHSDRPPLSESQRDLVARGCARPTERPHVQWLGVGHGYRHTFTCGCVLRINHDERGLASLQIDHTCHAWDSPQR